MKNILFLLTLTLFSFTTFAQEKKEDAEKPIPIAKSFVTKHQGTFGKYFN